MEIAPFHRRVIRVPFILVSKQNPKNNPMIITGIGEGGLGLPVRNYHFCDNEKSKKLRAADVAHVAKLFELAGDVPANANSAAAAGSFFLAARSGRSALFLGRVDRLLQARGEVAAEGGEVFHGSEGDELAREVADGGAFQGEANDGEAGFVGGGLAEEAVLRAASDDEDAFEFPRGHALEGAHRVGVSAAEGGADQACVAGEVLRRGELAALKLRIDRGFH